MLSKTNSNGWTQSFFTKVSKRLSIMHFVVRKTIKMSGKSLMILWGLIDGHSEVILIEFVDSPTNYIGLKCDSYYPAHQLLHLFFMSFTNLVQPVANFYCLHSTGYIIGPLDHVKNCLIMCSNYWCSWKSHLSFVNLTEVKIVFQEKTALIFCKTWKCELICLPWIPGVVTPISEPMISWICALNPQIKCKFV